MALKKPVVLTILDGWGYRAESFANAVALARKPTYDKLLAEFLIVCFMLRITSSVCPMARWATAKWAT